MEERPRLKGRVTITDIELMIYLKKRPRQSYEIALEFQLEIDGAFQMVHRLRGRGFCRSVGSPVYYELTEEGKKFIDDLKNSI